MIVIKHVMEQSERDHVAQIRKEVFVIEQGVPEENEYDEHDPICDHVLAYLNDLPAGTGRLRIVDGIAKLERICVLASMREGGLGKRIVLALEATARKKNLSKAKLNAQIQAQAFYDKLGYRPVSEVFMEENIPHVTMVKELSSATANQ